MTDLPLLWADGIWPSMFHLGPSVLEKALRPILVYLFLVVLLRVFGKRELAQLNPFDLIVLLSLSNTLQNAMIGDDNSVTGGLIGAFSLCAINYLVVRFLFRHRRLDQMIEGKPAVLIEDGKLRPKALARELLSRSELLTIVHRQGFASLDEVQSCVLEPGGTFSDRGQEAPPGRPAITARSSPGSTTSPARSRTSSSTSLPGVREPDSLLTRHRERSTARQGRVGRSRRSRPLGRRAGYRAGRAVEARRVRPRRSSQGGGAGPGGLPRRCRIRARGDDPAPGLDHRQAEDFRAGAFQSRAAITRCSFVESDRDLSF